jgi:hypothetical protein
MSYVNAPGQPNAADENHLSRDQKRPVLPLAADADATGGHAPGAVCWRCGIPFAQTTDEALRFCTFLAQRSVA